MKWRTGMAALGLLLAAVASAQTPTGAAPKVDGVAINLKSVALVEGVLITQADLDAVLRSADPVPVQRTEGQRQQAQARALSMLIDNVLMRKFLEEKTRPVPAAEVERRLAELEAGLRKQDKSLAEMCQEMNKTPEQLKADVADHLRWNAYVAAQVSDKAVEQYYAENKDFFDGVRVRASHIVIRLPAPPAPGEANRERAEARARAAAEARAKLENLRKLIKGDPKADFAELAKAHSQDPQGKNGGDLGWIPRKWFDESFSRAAFALAPGQVSEVVETEYGLHLIKVTEREAGKPLNLARMREAVREFCAEDLRQQILAERRKGARIEIK